ncbi:hypothetical protein GQR58_017343 [Nymphon striatum]|nr:hypothetical protein GQR58_017343 [Nymphon striatum]
MNIYEIVTSNQRRSLKIDQNLLHIPLLSLWVFLSITHHANRMLRAYVQEQVIDVDEDRKPARIMCMIKAAISSKALMNMLKFDSLVLFTRRRSVDSRFITVIQYLN